MADILAKNIVLKNSVYDGDRGELLATRQGIKIRETAQNLSVLSLYSKKVISL